jgi:hypothetical protein
MYYPIGQQSPSALLTHSATNNPTTYAGATILCFTARLPLLAFDSQSFSSCFPIEHVDVQIRVAEEPKS